MAKHLKQITASANRNRLQRRFRDYAVPTAVEDIHAEHVTEDELVELVKFAKAQLLTRLKKYNLESTKKNILNIREVFDLNKQEEQYQQALQYAIEHIELIIQVALDPKHHPDKMKKVCQEGLHFAKLLKEFKKK